MASKGEHIGWFNKAQSFRQWKQYKQALTAIERAIKAKPNYVEAWAEKGQILAELDDMKGAIVAFDKLIKLRPDVSDSWTLKGLALEQAGQIDQAKALFSRMTIEFDEDPSAFLAYGAFLSRHNSHEEALAVLNQGLEIEVGGYDPIILLATRSHVFDSLGRYEEALSDLERIRAYGDFYLFTKAKGEILEKMERYEEALEAYTIAAAEEPREAELWLAKGLLLEKLERLDMALNWYDLSVFSIDHEGWLMRGQLLQRLKRYEEAIDAFDQALVRVPQYANAHYDRAVCLGLMADGAAALSALTQAIGLNPEFRAMAMEDPAFNTYCDRAEWQTIFGK